MFTDDEIKIKNKKERELYSIETYYARPSTMENNISAKYFWWCAYETNIDWII